MVRTPKNPKRFYCTQSLFIRIIAVDLTSFSLLTIKLIFVLFQDCNIRPKSERLSPPQVHCNHSFWVIDSWILEHGIIQGDSTGSSICWLGHPLSYRVQLPCQWDLQASSCRVNLRVQKSQILQVLPVYKELQLAFHCNRQGRVAIESVGSPPQTLGWSTNLQHPFWTLFLLGYLWDHWSGPALPGLGTVSTLSGKFWLTHRKRTHSSQLVQIDREHTQIQRTNT